jgi:transcriptional regulator with XRE-family HTH domain
MKAAPSFSRLVSAALARRGLGLREFCRRAGLDPSFVSKVLSGKRNPPSEEEPLRRVAEALALDPVEVIVSAGRIPSDWGALWSDAELLRAVHEVATKARPGARGAIASRPPRAEKSAAPSVPSNRGLSEELL